jgi:hypothetical protein
MKEENIESHLLRYDQDPHCENNAKNFVQLADESGDEGVVAFPAFEQNGTRHLI